MITEHGIKNAQQLANTSNQSYFPRLTTLEQLSIISSRDGLFDPGGIGLPPSLTIQGGLCIIRSGFNHFNYR
jgi:hypothetical protein